jgi:hypothetical protein
LELQSEDEFGGGFIEVREVQLHRLLVWIERTSWFGAWRSMTRRRRYALHA